MGWVIARGYAGTPAAFLGSTGQGRQRRAVARLVEAADVAGGANRPSVDLPVISSESPWTYRLPQAYESEACRPSKAFERGLTSGEMLDSMGSVIAVGDWSGAFSRPVGKPARRALDGSRESEGR